MARQVNTTGDRSGCSGRPYCPSVSQCAFRSPQCDYGSVFEPAELATASLFRALRRLNSSHARVDKPLITMCLKDLWLYPHLVWPVRSSTGRSKTIRAAMVVLRPAEWKSCLMESAQLVLGYFLVVFSHSAMQVWVEVHRGRAACGGDVRTSIGGVLVGNMMRLVLWCIRMCFGCLCATARTHAESTFDRARRTRLSAGDRRWWWTTIQSHKANRR